jgi:pseudaminic acid synthase
MNVFIIAELSANHNNDLDLAIRTIKAMSRSGADAVKVQTYRPGSLTIDIDTGYFCPRPDGLWAGYTPWTLYEEAAMPYDWQPKLKKVAEDLGLVFFSSPFDMEGVDFLAEMDVPIYKIASFEITDIPLISYAASKQKPMIISTGVAGLDDIELAIKACHEVGNHDITLLKCTSQYPASIEQANILTMPDIKKRYNVKVGLSDHTMGSLVPVVAVALGATVVEKHFIIDRKLGGPDSSFSMEPHEFRQMVDDVRDAEAALGKITYDVSEQDKLRRRSLFITRDVKADDIVSKENVRSIRPGHGLHPKNYRSVIGQKFCRDYPKGTALEWSMLEK